MDYAELFQQVQTYTENIFPDTYVELSGGNTSTVNVTTQINTFIQQAEKRIYNTVQIPSLRRNVTGSFTPNNAYLNCPSDFLSSFSLAVIDSTTNEYEYLLNKDVNYIRQAYPSATATGKPRYYGLFGSVTGNLSNLTFIIGPTPDLAYTAELHYFYYPASIVEAGTSWLGDNYSPALLYGTLVEAYSYMKGEADMLSLYNNKYQEAMMQLNRLGTGLERGDSYRDGQAKIKVNP